MLLKLLWKLMFHIITLKIVQRKIQANVITLCTIETDFRGVYIWNNKEIRAPITLHTVWHRIGRTDNIDVVVPSHIQTKPDGLAGNRLKYRALSLCKKPKN